MKQPEHPPHIIFINVDQLSLLDTISGLGCRHVRTPSIDRLLSQGTCFSQSYCTEPLCIPARTSWWTGVYPSEHGSTLHMSRCHADVPLLGGFLKEQGYEAVYVGKWHVAGRRADECFHVVHHGTGWGEITDADVTSAARAVIRHHDPEVPLFLNVGYLNPHDICMALGQERDDGAPRPLELGLVDPGDLPPLPPGFEYDGPYPAVVAFVSTADEKKYTSGWNELQWRYYLWKYYRLIEMVDRQIGLVLDEIDGSPLRDNSIIIFSSDHGEGMARHKTVVKQTLWDEVARVPMIISSSSEGMRVRKGHIDDEHLVSGVDIFPTICDFAGCSIPGHCRGRSLKPLALGEAVTEWRMHVYAECGFYSRTIRTADYKYIMEYLPNDEELPRPPDSGTHRFGMELLYDVRRDPSEVRNLAYEDRSRDVVSRHRDILREQEARLDRRPFALFESPRQPFYRLVDFARDYVKSSRYRRTDGTN